MSDITLENREYFEITLMNMMSNQKYVNLSFYSFIITKCKISFNDDVPIAAVSFEGINFIIHIGKEFKNFTLEERMSILVHECRHIMSNHVFRTGDRDIGLFNIAADIAINQTIPYLPGIALLPSKYNFPADLTTEQYYELLLDEKKKQEKEKNNQESKDSSPDGDSDLQDSNESSNEHPKPTEHKEITLDSHELWNGSDDKDTEELSKIIAEKMITDAISGTSKGNLPQDIENILENLRRTHKISWAKELRRYLSSKRGTKIETIRRRNRRFPDRRDLRGKKVQRDEHNIVVGVDSSGSMNDEDILNGLNEVLNLVKDRTDTIKVIQIDTEIKNVINFSKKNSGFKRIGYGGTYMGEIVRYLDQNNINPDVLIMISDMEIEDVSKDKNWNSFKKPVLWLSSRGIIPDWNNKVKKHRVIDIKNI